MLKQAFASVLCLIAAGCVSTYRGVDDATPSATIRFEKGYTTGAGFGTGTTQEYSVIEGERVQRAAFFTWTNSGPIARRVPAGQPIVIHANTTYIYTTGVVSTGVGYYATTGNQQCNDRAEFTPEANRTYVMVQAEQSVARCELRVVDADTGVAPADIRISTDNPNAPKP